MKAQKKYLIAVVITVIVLVIYLFMRGNILSSKLLDGPLPEKFAEAVEQVDHSVQEKMGEVIKKQEGEVSIEDSKLFWAIVADMQDCIDVRVLAISDASPIGIDPLVQSLQNEIGPGMQADRWMNWHLKWKDRSERRIRLEISENDEGKTVRELHLFAVDREALPIPVELPADMAKLPKDEALDQLLKEGSVYYKEKAGVVVFPTGDRIEYVEKNDILSEIEFVKGDKIYKCTNLKSKESCQCIR